MRYLRPFIVVVLFFATANSYAALPVRSVANLRNEPSQNDTSVKKQSLSGRVIAHHKEKVAAAKARKEQHRHQQREDVNSNSLLGIASILCSGLGALASCIALNGLFWGGTLVLLGPFFIGGICFAAGIVLAISGIHHDRHRGFARLGLVLNLIGGVPWFCLLFPVIGVGGF